MSPRHAARSPHVLYAYLSPWGDAQSTEQHQPGTFSSFQPKITDISLFFRQDQSFISRFHLPRAFAIRFTHIISLYPHTLGVIFTTYRGGIEVRRGSMARLGHEVFSD